jgi:hypothetical protein
MSYVQAWFRFFKKTALSLQGRFLGRKCATETNIKIIFFWIRRHVPVTIATKLTYKRRSVGKWVRISD